jgi:metal-dependent amidase/aminoacylase/carboxypeptidase family protein
MSNAVPSPSDAATALKKAEKELGVLSAFIHANPELGLEEWRAASMQVAMLKNWGFEVEPSVAGLPTAFKATWGKDAPRFCFMAEYDALPGLGHACGHNLIAASALGAAYAMKSARKPFAERFVVLLGLPARRARAARSRCSRREPRRSRRLLIAHRATSPSRTPLPGRLALHATFRGVASHAAQSPESGVNALDSVIQLFNAVTAGARACRSPAASTE